MIKTNHVVKNMATMPAADDTEIAETNGCTETSSEDNEGPIFTDGQVRHYLTYFVFCYLAFWLEDKCDNDFKT